MACTHHTSRDGLRPSTKVVETRGGGACMYLFSHTHPVPILSHRSESGLAVRPAVRRTPNRTHSLVPEYRFSHTCAGWYRFSLTRRRWRTFFFAPTSRFSRIQRRQPGPGPPKPVCTDSLTPSRPAYRFPRTWVPIPSHLGTVSLSPGTVSLAAAYRFSHTQNSLSRSFPTAGRMAVKAVNGLKG